MKQEFFMLLKKKCISVLALAAKNSIYKYDVNCLDVCLCVCEYVSGCVCLSKCCINIQRNGNNICECDNMVLCCLYDKISMENCNK